jgi:FkbM family methyltransferase
MKPALKNLVRRLLPKRHVPHLIVGGPLRGMHIVTSWNDYPSAILGYNERALLRWLDKNVRSGETWLDVGAHYGYTALAMGRLVGKEGRVFTFEPTLSTAGCVSRTISMNRLSRVTVVPMALGCPPALELKRISTVRGMSDSTLKKAQDEVGIFVASFDWLWPQICGRDPRIDGIKIDVQGMELEVVKGMVSSLKEWKPKLALEVHEGVDRETLLALLENCGYTPDATPIEPAAGETKPLYLDNRSYAFRAKHGAFGNAS